MNAFLSRLAIALASVAASVAFADSPEPALPKVVLLGDSIRLSYASAVAKALEGKAVVVSPEANGQDSENLLRHLKEWAIDERPDVVHFNCGIHDSKRFDAAGEFQVPLERYEANLRKIVARLRDETDAVVIFATTTPIVDERAAEARKERDYRLLDESIAQYNAVALRVMKELDVPIDDLHAAIDGEDGKGRETLIGSDGVHLTDAGRERLGATVAAFIAERIPAKPSSPQR